MAPAAVVQAAEAGGITTAWTVEHVVVPSGYESKYPYDASGKMAGGAEDFDLPDPLIWLTWAAAHTTTLRLGTGILIATQRNPVVTAKAVASLDHLSGGRLDLGVGVGWLQEEFDALGVPFAARGRRLDEYIDAMRALWTDDKASFHGEFVDFADCIMRPRPVNGSIPVVIGGHSDAAARRAGTRGDAFFPGSGSTEELAHLIEVMKRAADEAGRDGDAIAVYGCGREAGPKLDARIESLAELGVSQAVLPTFPPDMLADIGRDLVSRYG
ncbi:MAG: LLM class F420-dependent oxidoreductase [Ilumatobacteraceae bacterium]